LPTRTKLPSVTQSILLEENGVDGGGSKQLHQEIESEEEESGDPDEFFDVLDVLDGKARLGSRPPSPQNTPVIVTELDSLSDPRQTIDRARSLDLGDIESDSYDPENDNALGRLSEFINKLPTSSKRKAMDENESIEHPGFVPRKRVSIQDRNEAGVEGDSVTRGGIYII
jgi:U3 small nucleolar RNA-associated protein 14